MSFLVFAIILMGKRELVALLGLSCLCAVIVVWLFLAVPWVCLQFVIVVFPDHTQLQYFKTALDLHILSLRINYESFLMKDYLLPMVQTANLTNGTKVQLQKVN